MMGNQRLKGLYIIILSCLISVSFFRTSSQADGITTIINNENEVVSSLKYFTATIRATGRECGTAVRVSTVTIGMAEEAVTRSAPPPPPRWTVYMRLMDQNIPDRYYGKDIRPAGRTKEIWSIEVMINNDCTDSQSEKDVYYPIISWDPNMFCNMGAFTLWSEESGTPYSLLVADMTKTEEYQTKANDGEYFYIIWSSCVACNESINMDLSAGWSMISLPVITDSTLLSDVFPDAKVVYSYDEDAGYVRVKENERLEVGKGYWILLYEDMRYILTGFLVDSYTFAKHENGWAMIGGCTYMAQPSTDSCSIEVIYDYIPGSGYVRIPESENLGSGRGYWILLSDIVDHCNLTVESIGH